MRLWFWRRETREAELDEELRMHMDMATQARVERGANRKEAERSARLEFGIVELVKEAARDQWGRRSVEELAQDLRFALLPPESRLRRCCRPHAGPWIGALSSRHLWRDGLPGHAAQA